jgi:hypothetical protein
MDLGHRCFSKSENSELENAIFWRALIGKSGAAQLKPSITDNELISLQPTLCECNVAEDIIYLSDKNNLTCELSARADNLLGAQPAALRRSYTRRGTFLDNIYLSQAFS